MTIREARQFVGREVSLTWRDRKGEERSETTTVHQADFLPFYGPCLVTDGGEIALERIVRCEATPKERAA